ncbi:MAG: hypothetical protein O3B72_14235 [Proteobacteria bacterium]|nr:hypothetical protein [Pseudomonadota bacterium]
MKSDTAGVGLPEASSETDDALRRKGIDPDRLSVNRLGVGPHRPAVPGWLIRMEAGFGLSVLLHLAGCLGVDLPDYLEALFSLLIGLMILQAACQVLVIATERLAARYKWNHYIAGTLAEILSTTPELVVIAFLIPVSPATAFTISIVTIYNNALVFSLYSFFLPKDKQGKFLMPAPITEAGTQILIGGGSMGLILGLVMLTFHSSDEAKTSFHYLDLFFISVVLLIIFVVYVYKLVSRYAEEEAEVRETLDMSDEDVRQRLDLVYQDVEPGSITAIGLLFLAGMLGAVIGGEEVSSFATTMISDLAFNPILTALILALFAGMSEYVILWQSHRKQEYGIALANAFGGITQVMFLVLPFTLMGIAFYELSINSGHAELPLPFSLSSIFLLLFLFPTFYTLSSLLEEDHTLGILDTTIMTGIISFLIVLLVTYGG